MKAWLRETTGGRGLYYTESAQPRSPVLYDEEYRVIFEPLSVAIGHAFPS